LISFEFCEIIIIIIIKTQREDEKSCKLLNSQTKTNAKKSFRHMGFSCIKGDVYFQKSFTSVFESEE